MTWLTVSKGFDESERSTVALLFWHAFRRKLNFAMGPEEKALRFLRNVLNPRFALCAYDKSHKLLGVAGFKTKDGALVGGGFHDLAKVYGWMGATWRGGLLSVLERKISPDVLLMDGIFVQSTARGRGVGTALLRAVMAHASTSGLHSVRLDVIDTNPRARALYKREGFVAGSETHIGPLRHVFGFSSSLEMRAKVT